MQLNKFFTLFLIALVHPVTCVKILGIFPFPAKSHYTLGNALMKGLAEAGNDVTVIAPFVDEEPPKNGSYKTVHVGELVGKFLDLLKNWNLMESNDVNSVIHPFNAQCYLLESMDATLNHSNVQKLLKSEEKFDVVILEKFYNDALLGLAHHFKVPVIIFSAIAPSPCINGMIGNPEPFAYVRHFVTTFQIPMSFYERIQNTYLYLFQEIVDHYYFLPQHEKIMKTYFPHSPSIYDLYYNISLVFVNGHESYSQSVPLVPNLIPIGGFHVKPPKQLPTDLKEFLDGAKEGVVYLCLGSNLKVKDLPDYKRNTFLKAFGKLKEKVLMKWEEDYLEGQPANVVVRKWLPQSDLLAHPNIKLFITHGGLLSTTEALYHGVPLLAIPFFADQHLNALSAATEGYAQILPYTDPEFGEEKLSMLLDDLLHNPKYKNNAKMKSQLFHDRPLSPLETVNYWVNFVVRNKGAPHLRVAGIQLPWYQYHLLDIIGFFLVVFIVLIYFLYKLTTIFRGKKNSVPSKKLKRK